MDPTPRGAGSLGSMNDSACLDLIRDLSLHQRKGWHKESCPLSGTHNVVFFSIYLSGGFSTYDSYLLGCTYPSSVLYCGVSQRNVSRLLFPDRGCKYSRCILVFSSRVAESQTVCMCQWWINWPSNPICQCRFPDPPMRDKLCVSVSMLLRQSVPAPLRWCLLWSRALSLW